MNVTHPARRTLQTFERFTHPLLAALWVAAASSIPSSADSLLVRNVTLHPVSGPVLTNASLLVRYGRIAAFGAVNDTADKTVDATGLHLFPGLIAAATVLGLQEIDAVRATRDTTEVGDYTPDVKAWIAVNPDSELIPVARANGITHAQVIPMGGIVSGWSGVIALDGWTTEDLAIRREVGLHLYWPSQALDTTPKSLVPAKDKWKSPEDQAKEREKKLKEINDFFDDAEAYGCTRDAANPSANFGTVPAWEAMLPAIRREKPLWIHANELRQIRSALEWAAKRKLSAVLVGGRDAWRCAELIYSNRVPVVLEHVYTLPARDTDPYDVHFASAAVLTKAGVHVIFGEGTDRFGASNLRNLPYSAAQAMAYGLSREEALKGITLYPAQAMGIADQLGSIEPGKAATFFLASGDILDIRSRVLRVWINGREVSVESRHTRLYDRYKNRPKP